MSTKRKIEIFSAGCPVCQEAITVVQDNACASYDVTILDMNDPRVSSQANRLGIKSVPAIVIDGKLTDCCAGSGPDIEALKAAGLGVPMS
jgi:glutaredoxin 3